MLFSIFGGNDAGSSQDERSISKNPVAIPGDRGGLMGIAGSSAAEAHPAAARDLGVPITSANRISYKVA